MVQRRTTYREMSEKDNDRPFWKMRSGKGAMTYNFPTFYAMEKWILNVIKKTARTRISNDGGKTWKRWESVAKNMKTGMQVDEAYASARTVKS
jgi:hypothetical protein